MAVTEIIYIPTVLAAKPKAMKCASIAVIDVLRATTTITAALQLGCQRVIPCATVAVARQTAKKLRAQGAEVFLAGERKGIMIPGFDAGNSPLEFESARGKTLVLTTSNGTKAMVAAQSGHRVLLACLNNLAAVAKVLYRAFPQRIVILASGDLGKPSLEDSLAAGLLIKEFFRLHQQNNRSDLVMNSAAAHVFQTWKNRKGRNLLPLVRTFPHAQELIAYGYGNDVCFASRLNSTVMVGEQTAFGIKPYTRDDETSGE